MNIKEQLDNIFEFNDGEMTIHLNDRDSITVPAHVFVNSVMSKLEDYIIFAPFNGKDIDWIDSEHPDFKYADDNTYWVDINYNLRRRYDYRHEYKHTNSFKIARYYPYGPKSSKVSIHGELISKQLAKEMIYDCTSNIRKYEEELDYLIARLK